MQAVGPKSKLAIIDKVQKGIDKIVEKKDAKNQVEKSNYDSDFSKDDTEMRPHYKNIKTSLNLPNNYFSKGPLQQPNRS